MFAVSETPASFAARDAARFRVVAATALLALLVALFCANKSWSSGWTAALLAAVNLGLLVAHCVRWRDVAFVRLLLFGLVLGIERTGRRCFVRALYRHTGLFGCPNAAFVAFTVWMPFAWLVISVQIGYWGTLLMNRVGAWRGAALTAFVGAVNIPFYEQMAYFTHWWRYQNCLMWNHAPVYVIVAELFIGFCLAPLAGWALRGPRLRDAVWAGMLGGAATIAGGLIGYGLVERIPQWISGRVN